MVTGAFKTTPVVVLNYLANLPTMNKQLNIMVMTATVQVATLPASHPLHNEVVRCGRNSPRLHKTPLHRLIHAFPEVRGVEIINTAPENPWWKPQFSSSIAANKDAAKAEAQTIQSDYMIYVDGSGFEGGVGASAVRVNKDGEVMAVRRLYLGPSDVHTVFEGEVIRAILGLDIIAEDLPEPYRRRTATIFIDNQPSIRAHGAAHPQPARYLLETFRKQLKSQEHQGETQTAGDPASMGTGAHECAGE